MGEDTENKATRSKRPYRLQATLNEQERDLVEKAVEKTGLSASEFGRTAVKEYALKVLNSES